MGYRFARGGLLTIFAIMIVVPVLVVLLGTFKSMQQLFDSPFGLPESWSIRNYVDVLT